MTIEAITERIAALEAEKQAITDTFVAQQREASATIAQINQNLTELCTEANVNLGKCLGRIEDLQTALKEAESAQSHGDEPI